MMGEQNLANPLPAPNNESLAIGLELTHDLIKTQLSQNDALDLKSNFILGSATVIIGTYVAFIAAHPLASRYSAMDAVLLGAPNMIAYSITLFFAFMGFRVRKFTSVPHPRAFMSSFMHLEQAETRIKLLESLALSYEINTRQLALKAMYVSIALAFLCLQAGILMATFLLLPLSGS